MVRRSSVKPHGRPSSAFLAVFLVAGSGCAQDEQRFEAVGQSAQSLSLGPTTTLATNVVSAEAVATDTGYAVAYVTHDLNGGSATHLAFLDSTGAVEDGPHEIQTSTWEVQLYGVAWNGSQSLVVTQEEKVIGPQYVNGYFVAPGAPPTLAFSQDEPFINDNPAMAEAKMFGRLVFDDGVFWISGMIYGGGENLNCLGGTDLETAGGYRFDGAIATTTCGLAVAGPGAAGACLSRYFFHDDCVQPDQIELRVDTLPPSAPVVASTPPFIPRRAATHDDVIVVLGDEAALILTPAGSVVGAPPIAPAPEADIGYVVDRFVVVTEQTGTVHAVTLDPSGTSVMDSDVEVVPTGTRPFLAPRQDGTALLGYFVGEELKLGILEIASSSSTSSSSSNSSSSDSVASSGAGPVTTTTGSGGSGDGSGGAPNEDDDDDGSGDGCSVAPRSAGRSGGAGAFAASVLLALGARRRRRARSSGGSHAQN